jgi:hypothetical protein
MLTQEDEVLYPIGFALFRLFRNFYRALLAALCALLGNEFNSPSGNLLTSHRRNKLLMGWPGRLRLGESLFKL